MARLHLVRHGQASFDKEDYDQLSDRGVAQARLLGAWLADIGARPGALVAGALKRHRQTAESCVESWGVAAAVATDGGLDEFDHRELLDRFRPDLAGPGVLRRHLAADADPHRAFQKIFTAAVERWIGGAHDGDYRESWSGFRARCVAALDRAEGEDVWVFTSGGPIAAILQHVLGVADRKAIELSWSVLNASVTTLARGRSGLRLISFNGVGHLERAADTSLITSR